MAIDSIALKMAIDALETGVLSTSFPAASGSNVNHNQFSKSKALSASTTPVVTKIAYFSKALTAGAGTIDLTALPHNGGTVDGVGLKVQAILFKNPAANASMTLTPGASNGFNIFGASDGKLVLTAHATEDSYAMFYVPEGWQDIASGDRTIDIAGTGTQVLHVAILMG